MIRLVLALIILPFLAFRTAHALDQPNNDYYTATSSRELMQLLSDNEKYHLGPGIRNMRSRHYVGAYNDFKYVLTRWPNHPQALVLMVDLCEKWRARSCNPDYFFDKALTINPNAPGTLIAHGIYLQRQNRLDDAIASYEKALETAPDSVNAHYNLGLAYFAKKNYAKANEHAQQAYALGMPLPALRDKLQKAGAWQPLPETPPSPAESTAKEDAAK